MTDPHDAAGHVAASDEQVRFELKREKEAFGTLFPDDPQRIHLVTRLGGRPPTWQQLISMAVWIERARTLRAIRAGGEEAEFDWSRVVQDTLSLRIKQDIVSIRGKGREEGVALGKRPDPARTGRRGWFRR